MSEFHEILEQANQAVCNGDLAQVQDLFMDHQDLIDVDMDIEDGNESTFAHLAALNEEWDIVHWLVSLDPDVVHVQDATGQTVLHCCAQNGCDWHLMLGLMVAFGDPNICDINDNNVLHYAAEGDTSPDGRVVKLLLSNEEMDINQPNIMGDTPICRAIRYARMTSVKVLSADPRVDLGFQNEEGDGLLHLCVAACQDDDYEDHREKRQVQILFHLLHLTGCDPSLVNDKNKTALDLSKRGSLCRFLLLAADLGRKNLERPPTERKKKEKEFKQLIKR